MSVCWRRAPTRAEVAVVGDSAGGGLVFALLLRCRDEGRLPLPAAAVALSPWTDLALTGASLRRNAGADPFVDANGMPLIADCYLAGADPRHPYASPLYGDPAGLPPTLDPGRQRRGSARRLRPGWRIACARRVARLRSKYGRACRMSGTCSRR